MSAPTTSIDFYGFTKPTNTASPSGYCQKLETFLRAVNYTTYKHIATWPGKAPKGKLPYITLTTTSTTDPNSSSPSSPTTTTIPDSYFIIRHLIENNITPDLDATLSPQQRAESRAFQTWTEEFIYPMTCHTRWAWDKNYEKTVVQFKDELPWVVRPVAAWYMRRTLVNTFWYHGVGRHTPPEINRLLQEYVDSVSVRLDSSGKEFFHGDEPTMIDVILYGFFANALAQPGNPEYKDMLLKNERIKRFTAVLTRRWFPEYEETILKEVE